MDPANAASSGTTFLQIWATVGPVLTGVIVAAISGWWNRKLINEERLHSVGREDKIRQETKTEKRKEKLLELEKTKYTELRNCFVNLVDNVEKYRAFRAKDIAETIVDNQPPKFNEGLPIKDAMMNAHNQLLFMVSDESLIEKIEAFTNEVSSTPGYDTLVTDLRPAIMRYSQNVGTKKKDFMISAKDVLSEIDSKIIELTK